MGATSSNNNTPPPSAPLREPTEGTLIYGTQESCRPEYTNENIRQRTKTSINVGEEPQSQGPSPYSTFKGDESWNQRPSAPSLSNLRSPRRETLLTYVAQMTGWQAAEGHGPSLSPQHHEAVELSKVISQLAAANQQLATAYSTTLGHLEALYLELQKERESKRRGVSLDAQDEALRRRLTVEADWEDQEQKDRSVESRIDRLESLLANDWGTYRGRKRNLRPEEQRDLRVRLERLEMLVKGQRSEKEDQGCMDLSGNQNLMDSRQAEDVEKDSSVNNRIFPGADALECEIENQTSVHNSFDRGIKDSRFIDETDQSLVSSHLGVSKRPESRFESEQSSTESTIRLDVMRLLEEVERLKAERLEYQGINERLVNELAEEKAIVKKLIRDYEETKTHNEETESNIQKRSEEHDLLEAKLDLVTKETERLRQEVDVFNLQKDTAEAKISSLEEDLQKLLLEKEQIKNIESQKTSKLKAQLSEEVSDKKKQIKALEDALDEIQRLKETIKTGRNSDDNDVSTDNDDPIESIDDPQESPPTDPATNIEEFKKELTVKREARQRAIAAVSSEMERLRRELDAEKEAHSETSRVLDLLRSAQSDSQSQTQENTEDATDANTKTGINDQLTDEQERAAKRIEAQRLMGILKVSDELRNDIRFQIDKVDDLRYHLETDPEQHRYRIRCLSNITNRTREAVYARERRANELKDHISQILVRLGDRSFLDFKDDVGLECERQLENINSLKSLYNERLRVLIELKDAAVKELTDIKERLDYSLKKSECLEDDLKKADEKIDVQDSEISNLESQLGLTKADCRDLQNQMSLVNGLFTQMLIGASSADMDLDRLTQLLQENHDLISDMAREGSTEAAALPKLLLDLVEQVEGSKGIQKRSDGEGNGSESEIEKKEDDLQQEDIAHNLPKVWRVLLELLSCHAEGSPPTAILSSDTDTDTNYCYKSVDTPAGPTLVISVSKTYIRLKELILEKKHLEKEMNRMKQLNSHLESKLGEQEKRLSAVSAELSKTWTIVDRMQAQHHQLHTHEKILRYELQQKRKMLQELKQELEYCREKWESARQKNTNTELEWRCLRREFAARKALVVQDSFNTSAESGFSDERGDDTDEEDDAVEGRLRLGPRRKPRKENPRSPTPDTESEQPTDTELSEPKTGSSTTLEQRTPTPETETEPDETEVPDMTLNIESTDTTEITHLVSVSPQELLDPLDQALTNVIQNLIGMSEPSEITPAAVNVAANTVENIVKDVSPILEDSPVEGSNLEPEVRTHEPESPDETKDNSDEPSDYDAFDISANVPEDGPKFVDTDGEKAKTEEPPLSSVSCAPTVTVATSTPVFSIGPFPPSVVAPSPPKSVQFTSPPIVGPPNRIFPTVFGGPLSDTEDSLSFSSSFGSTSSISTAVQETESRSPEKRGAKSADGVTDSDSVSIDSSSSLETVKEFSTVEPVPSCGSGENEKKETSSEAGGARQGENKVAVMRNRTPEEALAAREDRLKRLEEQAKWLMNKMNATSRRGSALSTRLEELHEVYGEPPVPPPMPDVLPSRRLRTNLTDLPHQVPESSSTEVAENAENSVSDCSNESQQNNAP